MNFKHWMFFAVIAIFFRMSCSDRQVTFTCDGDGEAGVKGEAGVPGKRGPAGPRGPIGPAGSTADLTELTELVRRMNESLMQLRHYVDRIPSKSAVFC